MTKILLLHFNIKWQESSRQINRQTNRQTHRHSLNSGDCTVFTQFIFVFFKQYVCKISFAIYACVCYYVKKVRNKFSYSDTQKERMRKNDTICQIFTVFFLLSRAIRSECLTRRFEMNKRHFQYCNCN